MTFGSAPLLRVYRTSKAPDPQRLILPLRCPAADDPAQQEIIGG